MGLKELQAIREQRGKPKVKKVYQLAKKSAKKILEEKTQVTQIIKPKKAGWFDADKVKLDGSDEFPQFQIPKGSAELQRWFEDRRKEMTGVCDNCGGKTCKDDDKYYKFSIAHLMPKAYVKSIATHPKNWLELCHFGNGCHNLMDTKMLDLIDMNCFDKIVERVTEMYPSIATNERRRIPKVLLEYIETEK